MTTIPAPPPRQRFNPTLLLIALILSLVATSAMATEKLRDSAIVLMYHHVGDERYPSTNIRLEQFEAHLDFFQREGFRVWPLARVVEKLRAGEPLPDKTVAITFDDAYKTVYSEAFPRLKARGWPFTVFVSSDYIDKRYANYMSWEQMRRMEPFGASFGNHSRSHGHLIDIAEGETTAQWRARMKEEIGYAQRRLESELTQTVKMFAYPYGEYDLALAEIVAELGFVGFGQQSGPAGRYADFRFLPRFPVNEAYGDLDGGLKTKLLSLALPVVRAEPLDPVTTEPKPRLVLTLANSPARLTQLACFASGQGKIDIEWLDPSRQQVAVTPRRPIPVGRSRYNCTAPSNERGRYFWFSHPWLRKHDN